jgi:hypothetical protein
MLRIAQGYRLADPRKEEFAVANNAPQAASDNRGTPVPFLISNFSISFLRELEHPKS